MPQKYLSAIIFVIVGIIIAIIITASLGDSPSTDWQAPTSGPDTSVRPTTGPDGKPLTTTPTSPAAAAYTLADVARHATATDCWAAVNGGVYDLTAWIAEHPGGREAIIGLCGKDGSAAFNRQHGGKQGPANELATFKIGTLNP